MKHTKIFGVCLTGLMALNLAASAKAGVLDENPYKPIAARNIFQLNAVPLSQPQPEPTAPLAHISVVGLMTILGGPDVLFKASSPAQSGKSEKCYTLGEGQIQDDIQVVSIDIKNSLVVFRNHGVIQKIPLGNGIGN